jgi:hypothetical protein
MQCPECEKGPQGAEGHGKLFSEAMTQGQMQFKCATCSTVWSRRYLAGGLYAWEPPQPGVFGGMRLPKALDQK